MLRVLPLLLVGATAFAAPQGKVVRVERRVQKSGPIRVCEIRPNGTGMCFGEQPGKDDVVEVIGDDQVFAEARVVEATSQSATCDSMWNVKVEVLRGDLSNSQWTRSIGVIDTRLDRRSARKIPEDKLPPPPSGNSEENTIAAIDRTGKGSADIALTRFACDAGGAANPSGSEQCFGLWTHDQPSAWKLARTLLVSPCFR